MELTEHLGAFYIHGVAFDSKRLLSLSKSLDPVDKKKFIIDIGELAWDDYFANTIKGVRQYLSKESPKNLEKARRKDKM